MELRTIGYFVAVADAGSVSAATQLTHITQPSLSRQLRQLESELGLELFHRRDGRLALSPAGRQFLPAARELLRQAAATRSAAAQIKAGSLPTLTVAASPVTLNDVVAPFFATFDGNDPMPRVQRLDAADEYAALDRGADLVIGTRPPPAELARARVAALPVNAYVRADHELAGAGRIGLTSLADHDLLVPSVDSHARRALDAAIESATVPFRLLEFSSSQVAQAVAAAGRGVAVVSDDARFDLKQLSVIDSAGEVLRIGLHAAWQSHHHGAEHLAGLVTRLRAFVQARYAARN